MPAIKFLYKGTKGRADIGKRRFTNIYEVTGLDCFTDYRKVILPTTTSPGLMGVPGSFPTAFPDGTMLPDAAIRLVSTEIIDMHAGKARVECEYESRIGDFDQEGAILMDVDLDSTVEWVPSNWDIKASDGTPSSLAVVNMGNTIKTLGGSATSTAPTSSIAELSIPRNRLTVHISMMEQASFTPSLKALTKTQKVAFTNSATLWGGGPRTWLCTKVRPKWLGISDYPWQIDYEFVYKAEQWTQVAFFQDQILGRPFPVVPMPTSFDPGTVAPAPVYGWKVFRIAGEYDFTNFKLPDISTM